MKIDAAKKYIPLAALVLLGALLIFTVCMRAGAEEPKASETPQPTPTENTKPEESEEPENGLPAAKTESWELLLANKSHSISEYAPEELSEVDSVKVDSRIVAALTAFKEAAEAEGYTMHICSGYRDYQTQRSLYNNKVAEYGVTKGSAIVAPPGTSEHQTGLACDIADGYYQYLSPSLENTELFQWMYAHCQEYGFILRYPKDKVNETGFVYEPWHFRYVGTEAATYIMENNLCLEEFLALYE